MAWIEDGMRNARQEEPGSREASQTGETREAPGVPADDAPDYRADQETAALDLPPLDAAEAPRRDPMPDQGLVADQGPDEEPARGADPENQPAEGGKPGAGQASGPGQAAGAGQAPEENKEPRASRGTTLALAVALVLVVVMTGVLGAVAVLMTRNPDAAPLSHTPIRRLATPVHFAPVTGVRAAPCTGTDAIPDDQGTTCYQLDPGVTVTTVQKVEQLPESDGTYSIRLVLSPANRDQIADLTRETVKQQLAIVAGERVVAAPRVAQELTQDSLGIAGFTKEQADNLFALLTGSAPPAAGTAEPTQPGEPTAQPTQPAPGSGQPAGTQPAANQPGNGERQTDPRFVSCREAKENGYGGPYTKGLHPEYHWYEDADGDGVACDPDELT